MDHAGTSNAVAVRLIRTNFAWTGSKVTIVLRPLPAPAATAFQDVPSVEASTLYPRGNPGGPPAGAPSILKVATQVERTTTPTKELRSMIPAT